MNDVVKEAYKRNKEWRDGLLADGFPQSVVWKLEDLPDVELGEIVELGKVWDCEMNFIDEDEKGVPNGSYCYPVADECAINYEWEVVEEDDNLLKRKVRITDIQLI